MVKVVKTQINSIDIILLYFNLRRRKYDKSKDGKKIWISGTDDNEVFGRFWQESHENGLVKLLHKIRGSKQETIIIDSGVFGVYCVEKDPNNRSFYFFIATECDDCPEYADLEEQHLKDDIRYKYYYSAIMFFDNSFL